MVNSTAVGGGVAEMLNRLIPLMNELEVATKWEVITGGNDFFEVTKGFHNALHGGEYAVTQAVKDIFMMYNEQNRQRMEFVEDLFVIHDPQPAALIRSKERNRGRWIWRCHIDLSNPESRCLGIPAALRRPVRCRHFFLARFQPAACHPAVPVLSLH